MFGMVPRTGINLRNREIDSLFDSLTAGFSDFFGDTRYRTDTGDIAYEIECPGFNKENLTVEIADGILTVQGSRGEGDSRREIFKRMSVGATEEVEAEIKDGILKLVFKQPQKKTTKLDIK